MKHTKGFNTDLIVDPYTYLEVVKKIEKLDPNNIYVVTNEPRLAQKLLAKVDIEAKIKSKNGNICYAILFMSRANAFIGTKSQVSQLVNIFVENNGGESYMLNFSKHNGYDKFKNTEYIKVYFLAPHHPIYSFDFK
jgi:hypothetical protein